MFNFFKKPKSKSEPNNEPNKQYRKFLSEHPEMKEKVLELVPELKCRLEKDFVHWDEGSYLICEELIRLSEQVKKLKKTKKK